MANTVTNIFGIKGKEHELIFTIKKLQDLNYFRQLPLEYNSIIELNGYSHDLYEYNFVKHIEVKHMSDDLYIMYITTMSAFENDDYLLNLLQHGNSNIYVGLFVESYDNNECGFYDNSIDGYIDNITEEMILDLQDELSNDNENLTEVINELFKKFTLYMEEKII